MAIDRKAWRPRPGHPPLLAERTPEIETTFIAMAAEFDADESRPSVEFYRSTRELILFLPVK